MAVGWKALGTGALTGIDWNAPAAVAIFDPYIAWLEATELAGQPIAPDGHVPLALELDPTRREEFMSAVASQQDPRLLMPAAYRAADAGNFCTARVRLPDLRQLVEQGVKRVDLGLVARFKQQPWFMRLFGSAHRALRDFIVSGAVETQAASNVTLAVIDHGCAFANRQFRRHGSDGLCAAATRVRWLWDQGSEAAAPPADFGYGSEWREGELDALMRSKLASGQDFSMASEAACYKSTGFTIPRASAGWHGTHVMDLLAGRADPLGTDADVVDEAGRADLIFVNLPERAIADVSGGWLSVHVLDALRYVMDRAPADRALVVNISVGAHAGGHDGRSVLESAIDELLRTERPLNTFVTLAAGNAFAMGTHAQLTLGAAGTPPASKVLVWDVPAQDATDSFMEIWMPVGAEVSVSVKSPTGPELPSIEQGAWVRLADADAGKASALVLHAPAVATGNGAMILLALGPTSGVSGHPALAPPGLWRVTLSNRGALSVDLDAWIERDDPDWSPFVGGKQSKFADHVTEQGTLSSLACGMGAVVVGALTRETGQVADFSSAGPTRGARKAPDLLAPGEQSAHPDGGLKASGVFSNTTVLKRGTSMAAPIVARAAANVLAARTGDMTSTAVMDGLDPEPVVVGDARGLKAFRR